MQEHSKQVIQHYIAAYNAFDVQGMIRDLHQDIVFENISNGVVNLRTEGIEAFTSQAEAAKQYFSQRQQTVDSWSFQENNITAAITYEARVATDLPNGMKAGDTVKMTGQSEFRLKDGLIIGITDKS
ncbi:nuclear transport factor 2 family protein [Rufibacter sediminis]|uniref:Nuclear transport factor 2 family protein n=1 Tax=Rufibacter sediminis TaxID=2762756 RepID=A0ABR6VPW1_9BACT|nr:nuclear transport factor 2 family protein [Rufibacter sediminis]MBC3539238.1 nuclear transport factor 2 family protein [Rufibacter sediminis]